MASIPFTTPVYGGFGQCNGLIRPEIDALVLEFQVEDTFFRFRGKAKSIRVPLAELESVELIGNWFGRKLMNGHWFGRKLVIKSRSLMALGEVPGSKQGRVDLIIARADVAAAEQLVAGLYE